MAISYLSLDNEVRKRMLEEAKQDLDKSQIFLSNRLTATGKAAWPALLRTAIESKSDTWLAQELRGQKYLEEFELRAGKRVHVPSTAAETLAEGEFNRHYIRGVCKYALELGESDVIVYRGKQVDKPRPTSEQKIGQKVSAQKLLDDLRTSMGVETALGLPPGPNSGLSVKRI